MAKRPFADLWKEMRLPKPLFDIWWDAAICDDNIRVFARRAKRAGYSYDDCRRFLWLAVAQQRLREIKDEVWKPSRPKKARKKKR